MTRTRLEIPPHFTGVIKSIDVCDDGTIVIAYQDEVVIGKVRIGGVGGRLFANIPMVVPKGEILALEVLERSRG